MRAFVMREKIGAILKAGCIAASLLFTGGAAFAQGFVLPDNSVIQGHVRAVPQLGATPPVAVGCTIAANATDFVGTCTATAASGTITFARTQGAAPSCIVWDQSATSTVSMPVYTVSATAITLTTIISTHVLGYLCIGTTAGS